MAALLAADHTLPFTPYTSPSNAALASCVDVVTDGSVVVFIGAVFVKCVIPVDGDALAFKDWCGVVVIAAAWRIATSSFTMLS